MCRSISLPPAKVSLREQLISPTPWYVNIDSTQLTFARQARVAERQKEQLLLQGNVLREVIIRGRRAVKGSQFNAGSGAVPDLVFDEKLMKEAGKVTLETFLQQHIKGFVARMMPCSPPPVFLTYSVNCKFVVLSIDGVYLSSLYSLGNVPVSITDYYNFLRSYLLQLTTEDIRGIETKEQNKAYYIEVTTYSGNGAYLSRSYNNALYSPIPLSWPKQFYQPRYVSKNEIKLADLRSTIYWAPNLSTDAQGKLTVSFPTKSKAGKYTFIMQGSDLNGSLIYHRQTFSVP